MEAVSERRAIEPMSFDANYGVLRSLCFMRDISILVNGAIGCSVTPRWEITLGHHVETKAQTFLWSPQDVAMGGGKLLEEALEKLVNVAQPEVIVIQNAVVPKLIGDDVDGIARRFSQRSGVKIISLDAPNFAGDELFGYVEVVNKFIENLMKPATQAIKGSVNILGVFPGEYNWINDLNEAVRLLEAIGLKVNTILIKEHLTPKEIEAAPNAEANVLIYPEAGLPAAEKMEKLFGTPYIETELPPIGIEATKDWLLRIADHFGARKKAETLIEDEIRKVSRALSYLDIDFYNFSWIFGKTYALEGAPFRLAATAKMLSEDLSMTPTTIAYNYYDDSSNGKLQKVLKDLNLSPEVQTSGDFQEFVKAITRNHIYPGGDPWVAVGTYTTALWLALHDVRLPLIRYSTPVWDEIIVTDVPFMGFRGLVTMAEKVINSLKCKTYCSLYPSSDVSYDNLCASETLRHYT